jgi:nucleotide-binding universal stress UspA family protein
MRAILVPVDFSDVTLKVVKVAAHLAKPFQSKIILMHVSELAPQMLTLGAGPDVVPVPPPLDEDMPTDAEDRLARLQELVRSLGLESTSIELKGPPLDHILAQAETSRVDLIVIGSHSRGPLYHLFVGGVTDGILKRARCPVLVVPLSETGN